MSSFENFKTFVSSRASSEISKKFMEYAFKAVTGDMESLVQLLQLIKDSPSFYKNVVFTENLLMFLDGVCLNEEDYKGLAETIANGNQEENARRILDCIDSVETKSKVKYLVNATRSTIKWHRGLGGLSKNEYFRMIYILKNILLEDIEFIIEKLKMKELITCESCVALYNLGLMYYTTIEDNTMYAFSSLAYRFYEEVIKYDDENLPKILTPKEFPEEFQLPSNVVYFSEID